MPLPSITTIQVATVPLAAYLSRSAAILAAAGGSSPLPEINFMNATVILGDGNVGGSGPTVPAISTLQASGAVTHEVWRGTIVQAVTIDPANSNQVDILCVVPAVDGSGAEIGPFWATEFIVTDELGTAMLAGTTLMPKLVTANGSAVDLAFIASVGLSLGTVVLTPPSAAFCTMAQVEAKWNAHLPTAVTPLTQTDATASDGWTERVFGVHLAAKPADAVTDAGSIAALGATRAASDAEFAAGTAAGASTFKTPYPTLEQIAAALLALRTLPSTSVPGTTTVYRNHGTYTFTPPAGVTRVYVKIWGAGGGGGGLTFNTTASGAGAGGGGGYAEGAVNVTPGVGVTVTVGAGGAGGAGSGNATGGAGGAVSFAISLQRCKEMATNRCQKNIRRQNPIPLKNFSAVKYRNYSLIYIILHLIICCI